MRRYSITTVLRPVTLVFSSLLLLSACEQPAQQSQGGMPNAQVETITAKAVDAPFIISVPATVSGSKEVEIRARVSGVLESRNFSEGQRSMPANPCSLLTLPPTSSLMSKPKRLSMPHKRG